MQENCLVKILSPKSYDTPIFSSIIFNSDNTDDIFRIQSTFQFLIMGYRGTTTIELNNIKYTTNPILCTYHISSLVNFFVIKLIRFFRSSYVRSVNTVGNKGYDLIIFMSLLSLPPTICVVISQ